MKKIIFVFSITLLILSCKNERVKFTSVGDPVTADDAKSTSAMSEKYKAMRVGDTIHSKMIGKVEEVCQNKGCWMKMNLEDGEEVIVKFKDYGFFMPKDIKGKEVVINGIAYLNEISVDEQRHYAEDAGKSANEIAAITKPKVTYSFEANGVLIKEL